MAGKYFEFIVPGYSTLFTRDLPYQPGSGEAADLNPFDPFSARPLVEGEWLKMDAVSGGRKFTRGGDNVVSVPGTPDDEEAGALSFPYFQEQGRFDAQATKMAHCVIGPAGYEFRTRMCSSAGLAVGDPVSVWDWDGPAGAWTIVRRVLAKATSGGFIIGRVTRIYGTNDISVLYQPQSQ